MGSAATYSCIVAGVLCSLSAGAAAQRTIGFSDGAGLSAEIHVALKNGGSRLVVTVRNHSEAEPIGQWSADRCLTGFSFDFGAPGLDPSDPQIVGGSARTGPASRSVNFDLVSVGSLADVSGEYGFANDGGGALMPNLVSTLSLRATPFGGPNLDGPVELDGPAAGLLPLGLVAVPVGSEGVLQGTLVVELDLDRPLSSLSFLDANPSMVEFGSGILLGTTCTTIATTVLVPDPLGLNVPLGLTPVPGNRPTLGNPTYMVNVDDPTNACGITPGSLTKVYFSAMPASMVLPQLGCQPGSPGHLLLDPFGPLQSAPRVPWQGPGQPATHSFAIPGDPALCGTVCCGQALFFDGRRPDVRLVLTDAIDIFIGI